MLFSTLYNLLNEQNVLQAISFEDLAKYYYYHIGAQDRSALAINNYLKDNNISNRYAMVVVDNENGVDPYYFFLVSKVMSRPKRSKLVKEIKALVGPTAQMRMTHYGEYPAEDIYNGNQYVFDPMDKYNLDDETKETWKDILPNL